MIVQKMASRRLSRTLRLPREKPEVYVLPIFEVERDQKVPNCKRELKSLLEAELAVPFHKYVCPECHMVPRYAQWVKAPYSPRSLNVFHIAKRQKPYEFWEPIYIGTNDEPLYDNRLSWEGLRDKMSQGYALCILDYRFKILDNAFLVHRPGIKKMKHPLKHGYIIRKQNKLIEAKIAHEIEETYGTRAGCYI